MSSVDLVKKKIREEERRLYLNRLQREENLYSNANFLSQYAIFLQNRKGDFGEAQKYFEFALELAPHNSHVIYNFAKFFEEVRCNYDEAESLYKRLMTLMKDQVVKHNEVYTRAYRKFLIEV